ncbi:MAG TPA: DUF559 domain-containing protein [Chitinophagales bacterium]|nr:DUF559 domain-containing protein [Chitinophagales bacterium]
MKTHSNNDYNLSLKPLASALRKNMTPPEKLLWKKVLCESKMLGYRFLRQRSIDNYIADFFCKELKLLIEVDGKTHDWTAEKDSTRDKRLAELGYHTFRVNSRMVMHDIVNVSREIEGIVIERETELGAKPTERLKRSDSSIR